MPEVSLDLERFVVEVRPLGDSDAAIVRALEVVENRLGADGLDSTVVHVSGRSYRLVASRIVGAGR